MSRIAFFFPSLNGGGAERVMVTLANALADRGHAIDLVLASAHGPFRKDVSPQVRVIDLQAGRVIKSLLPLARYLRRESPVAMLAAQTHANVVTLVARRLARVATRVVVSERSTISVACSRARGAAAWLNYALVPSLYRTADGICTVSRAASKDLVRFAGLPAARVSTIYNPFDLDRITRLADEPLGDPWLEPGKPPIVLAVGRLAEEKDFPTLIRAFARLRSKRPLRLLILGEGALRPMLEELIARCKLTADDVRMPGFVQNPFAYLARCSVFVLSSRWEGLPGVLIEALACGAPVVSTDCPSGPHEILEGGRWGSLVAVGDPDALAGAIAATLDTPRDRLPDVRRRAQDFEQERAVAAYLKLLGC
ncbi:MAG: glycosyltransferase [Burkholderiaceae bacterium]|nr:glycosyltransferase [Burkholderiaceae bacterium]